MKKRTPGSANKGTRNRKRTWSPEKPKAGWNPWIVLLIAFFAFTLVQQWIIEQSSVTVPYSEFLTLLEEGKVKEVKLSSQTISGVLTEKYKGHEAFKSVRVQDDKLPSLLKEKGVTFEGTVESRFWSTVLAWILPLFLLILFWRFMFQQFSKGSGGGGLLSMGKSKAKIYVETDVKVSFSDVAGVDEVKEELEEIVNFLKEPEYYSRLGGRTPKGVLLVGPPGTGKTLLARAVAGEASAPFFSINGSEFVEMFVGLGAARVRDLFEQARKSAPCIIFVDELDALGKARSLGQASGGANDEKEQTLNQLLAELDGFDSKAGIILLGATNRPEILDPALLRAGRFDRQILVDKPDQGGREQILRIHAQKIKMSTSVDLKKIASLTPGFSGADLANLVNEAALVATRRDAKAVDENDFTMAIERIVAGLERKKRIMNSEEKERVAHHEMGHATVAFALWASDRVHKVSIIPRGIGALGYTLQRPTEDRYLMTFEELMRKIVVLLGGRASEWNSFADLSTGASDDLSKASDIARSMVTRYGMSARLGLATYDRPDPSYLVNPMGPQREPMSEKTNQIIDEEVKRILDLAWELALESLQRNSEFLAKGIETLLEKETMDEKQIKELWSEFGQSISVEEEKKALSPFLE